MIGLSTGSTLLGLTKYHLLFDIVGGLILLGSLIYIWHEHESSEKSAWKNAKFWTCLVVTFAMYGAMSFVIKYVVAPRLGISIQGSMHDHR